MTAESQLIAAARSWIAGDPDPSTRAELEQLIAAEDLGELAERMNGTLAFGTAGLRGRVEAGSNRMNRAVVIRATRGLTDHLLAEGAAGPVVVGRDARLSSGVFMEDTVAVLTAAGLHVEFFPEPVPTPLVAYAALRGGASAAVVVTASHNPPYDNGYKVYADNAAQIIPPTDRAIADAIAAVGPAAAVERTPHALAPSNELASKVTDDLFDDYVEDLRRAIGDRGGDDELSIVYTPLHGVGGRYVLEALRRFGFSRLSPVLEQMQPDGHFPTVAFPNPEEPGALDLAVGHAVATDADLIVANDPDTDRLAAAAPRADGEWRLFTGNQIGMLLADHLLQSTSVEAPIVLSSIVSSPMLASVAQHAGARWARTLTGFKWIWNAALDLEAETGGRFVFGYEEALGYSVAPMVRDKDGISAAVAFVQLAAECRAEGITLWDRLDDLYQRHGLWVSLQESVVRPGSDGAREIADAMSRLGGAAPDWLGKFQVSAATDYRKGADTRPRYLAATALLEYELGDHGRALIRPSGTEPKIKVYVDLKAPPGSFTDTAETEAQLLRDAAAVARDVVAFAGLANR